MAACLSVFQCKSSIVSYRIKKQKCNLAQNYRNGYF